MRHKILSISNLSVDFHKGESTTTAVNNIDIDVFQGEVLGIVGESGSGKSLSSISILNLLKDQNQVVTTGQIIYRPVDAMAIDLLKTGDHELEKIRGGKISLITQEPMSALNPVVRCGKQVQEMVDLHHSSDDNAAKSLVIDTLASVQLNDPERIYNAYPFELSGGQLQRVCIAMAIIANPDILICDEPTTALDVTIQKEITHLLTSLAKEKQLTLIFICHDLDIVYHICDRVIVMRNGQILDQGDLPEAFITPKHEYTKALLLSKPKAQYDQIVLPNMEQILNGTYQETPRHNRPVIHESNAILTVDRLSICYYAGPFSSSKSKVFTAVEDVSFSIRKGSILGLVGESGSGKSSIANAIVGLIDPSGGTIQFENQEINHRKFKEDPTLRRKVQIVLQDPNSALNPKITIGDTLKEILLQHHICDKNQVSQRINALLRKVGLNREYTNRYPHQLSGGQRQRVCIAKSLAVEPSLLICDECVSALDMSVQAQILNLLDKLCATTNLTILFISHDLNVVRYLCDDIIVLHNGNIVERGPTIEVITSPKVAYTRRLVESLSTSI